MTHRIGKRFRFDAAHHLPSLPASHKCSRPHGHTYTAEVVLTATTLTGPGFVTDFSDLSGFKAYIDESLDHRDLNEVLDVEPTAEALAQYLAEWFIEHLEPHIPGQLRLVRVWETPTCWAEFEVEPR